MSDETQSGNCTTQGGTASGSDGDRWDDLRTRIVTTKAAIELVATVVTGVSTLIGYVRFLQ